MIQYKNLTLSGSLSVKDGITGSLQGSASYALTASFVQNAVTASYLTGSATASYALTASYLEGGANALVTISGSAPTQGTDTGSLWFDSENTLTLYVNNPDSTGSVWLASASSSYALTASYISGAVADNLYSADGIIGGGQTGSRTVTVGETSLTFLQSGSSPAVISFNSTGSQTRISFIGVPDSSAQTGSGYTVLVQSASILSEIPASNFTASYALSASSALTASYLSSSATASYSITASNAFTASYLSSSATASYSITSSFSLDTQLFSGSNYATLITTGSIGGEQGITGSLQVAGNLSVLGTSSFQYITSSQVLLNSNTITVQALGLSVPSGGLIVIDSGSQYSSSAFYYNVVEEFWSLDKPLRATASYAERVVGYSETFTVPSTQWAVSHSLDIDYPTVTCWDTSTRRMILPDDIESLDSNNVKIYFTMPITGSVRIS